MNFVTKDGDPQARHELLIALVNMFPNTIEGGCDWHIVHQGRKNNIPEVGSITNHNKKNGHQQCTRSNNGFIVGCGQDMWRTRRSTRPQHFF